MGKNSHIVPFYLHCYNRMYEEEKLNMKIVLSTLNAKYIHTNLAIRYLKAAALPEFDCELAEYTIKDPAFNIVSDLFQKKPDVIGFSCYIWNINETIAVKVANTHFNRR